VIASPLTVQQSYWREVLRRSVAERDRASSERTRAVAETRVAHVARELARVQRACDSERAKRITAQKTARVARAAEVETRARSWSIFSRRKS
jgi:hypothetical protein